MKQKPDSMFSEFPEHEREQHLRDNADSVHRKTVRREFTKEEIDGLNSEFASLTRAVNAKKEELKKINTEHKAEIKTVQIDADYTLTMASQGYDEKIEDVYAFMDHNKKRVEFFDGRGNFVESRHMTPEERQTVISFPKQERKTGNG